jgi:nucleoside-diphosphate-sugar epimerase
MKVLVIGGSRFFGKRLAELLLQRGDEVALFNRGLTPDDFQDRVERLRGDRGDAGAMRAALRGRSWDVVFDQMCFEAAQARAACELFAGRAGRYVFASSQSVYGLGAGIPESAFDARAHRFGPTEEQGPSYAEGKRQCESVFAGQDRLRVISARLPIVAGPDDYTGRFGFHVRRIAAGIPVRFPAPDAAISLISSEDAARALDHLGRARLDGPVNVSGPPIGLRALVQCIGERLGRRALVEAGRRDPSPYGLDGDWWMSAERLRRSGFVPAPVEHWLGEAVAAAAAAGATPRRR